MLTVTFEVEFYLIYSKLLPVAHGVNSNSAFSFCRARPVVTVDAQLLLHPMIINLENKTCQISESGTLVAW
jgi:hypothetical protein